MILDYTVLSARIDSGFVKILEFKHQNIVNESDNVNLTNLFIDFGIM